MCSNGTWKSFRGEILGGRTIGSQTDYERWQASQIGVSHWDLRRKTQLYKSISKDASIGGDEKKVFKIFVEAILPKPKSGRVSIFQRDGNEWLGATLRMFYLNQAKYSVAEAHRMLKNECERKQRIGGLSHFYEIPSLRQCRIYLGAIPKPVLTLARQG